ncbi:MAG TPA: NADH-quinone oxidoreductase subunit J [Acidobacteriota bacterium]|nr:NADH-quinone oxidoreductase subunit J [Acidobacteriota bacterium]
MNAIIFWAAAIVAVVAALRVITLRHPINSVLHLIVTLVCVAVLFLQLSAEFIAALQVIVYAGAIMVLFLFVVMLLNLRKDEFGADPLHGVRYLGAVAGLVLLGELTVLFSGGRGVPPEVPEGFGSVQMIGRSLFGEYLFPFELTSILLLAAALAAIVVARSKTPNDPEEA